jgi:ribosomal protein S18 acetylase RimI-like enzyme
MAADRSRVAAALAYKQAEEERRRRMMESVPVPGAEMPTAPPSQNFRRDLENLSIGIGEGLTRQLEGVKGIVTDPIGAAKGAYEGVRAVVRDPRIIADALRYTGQKAMSGPLGAGEVIGEIIGPRKTAPVMAELDVYHGTPHRFPATEANPLGEFDASKIGTGEGAQAYGHGVYYAENPEVAKGYQPRDPKAEAKLMNLYKQAEARQNYDAMEVLEAAMLHRTASELAEQFPNQKSLVNRIGKINEKAAGALYKADLPDEMIDRMLDWNKPLSQQPESVRKAFDDVMTLNGVKSYVPKGTKSKVYLDVGDSQDIMGSQIHDILKKNLGGSAESVSRNLKDYGIPGIKYLDAGSRGQGGSGTRNFVVFPGEEKKVRILERDGKKVAEMLQRTAPSSAEVEIDLYPLRSDPNTLYLSKIAVPQGQRGQGLGTKAMEDVIARADAEGKRVVLSPSTEYGATSVSRLKDFYKRFGFVENKGRNKNYAISETMYRDPKKTK